MLNSIKHVEIIGQTALTMAYYEIYLSMQTAAFHTNTQSFPSCFLQAKEPKALIKVDSINATFQPEKIGNPNGLQITYLKDYSTRNMFVYHDNGKVCISVIAVL